MFYLYLLSAIGVFMLLSGIMVVTQFKDFKQYWWAVSVCSLFWLPVSVGCWIYFGYKSLTVQRKNNKEKGVTT